MSYIESIKEKAESLEWTVDVDKRDITFQKYSPEGQDFSFSIYIEDIDKELDDNEKVMEVADKILEYYNSYDPSEETALWIGDDGHGRNGAPYYIDDLYEDMKYCECMIYELYAVLAGVDYDIKEETKSKNELAKENKELKHLLKDAVEHMKCLADCLRENRETDTKCCGICKYESDGIEECPGCDRDDCFEWLDMEAAKKYIDIE